MAENADLVRALTKINQRLDGIESGLKRSQSSTKRDRKSKDHDAEKLVKFVNRKLKAASDDIQEALYLNTLGFHLIAPWVCIGVLLVGQQAKTLDPKDWVRVVLTMINPVAGLVPMDSKTPEPSGDTVIDLAKVTAGEKIGSYEVTSGYGPRNSPGGIGSTSHKGVDVALPSGTPIKMPLDGNVKCHDQSEGNAAGTYAVIVPTEGTYEFMAAHLSQCNSGTYKAGATIALSGNTGNSTGPHLHWAQKPKGGSYMPPMRGYLELAVVGQASIVVANPVIKAIATQESGGDYTQVNRDSGALGKYQIMPDNVPSWSKECLGQSISAQQFLGSSSLQEKIATCKLTQEFERSRKAGESSFEACRSTAAFWYSGNASNKNSSKPQGGYPSIQDYTIQVCSKVGKQTEVAASRGAQTTFAIYAGYEIGSAVSLGRGKLLTNYHVVKGSNTVNVKLSNGFITRAKLIKQSPSEDLALLSVSTALPGVPLAANVRQGERITAIGNQLGKMTRTTGSVSAISAMVQHSAHLDRGNSGGALLNDRGQLVGINAQCDADERGNCKAGGNGFAIPVNKVRRFIDG
ncbi:MAG: trypsin-like peptidase domain-containing protein [Tildeniella nuda ZEHNDER 1965/U140]|jgi:S1-C subfamily serine protease|nr:trypsin-like peptidase domain-containing protein [Tildeniella nuda ZEHNDER 1965/U140]